MMRGALVVIALGVSLLAFAACSESPAASGDPTPREGGAPLPDASEVPDTGDAGGDADAGPARVCSEQNFCHTAVPEAQTLRAGWSDADGIAWAISSEGAILRWDGTAWSVQASGLGELLAIWGSGPTDLWVGASTGLYHGQGASSATVAFAAVSSLPGESTPISAIWGTGPDDVWATGPKAGPGYGGRVLHYAGEAAGWTVDGASTEPIQYARVWGTTASGVWLTGIRNDSKNIPQLAVRRRAVGSADFVEIAVPGDPAYAPDNPYAKLNKVWSVSASSDNTAWILGEQAFGKPGYLVGTTDDAAQPHKWTFVGGGDKAFFLPNAIWGISKNDAWLGGDYGRLRHWDGAAWKQAFITITKYPVVDPFYGIWGRGADDLWIVGAGIAIHRASPKSP